MKRLSEIIVTDESVKFAGAFVDDKFKKANDIEKSLVLNTTSHGFFIGARHLENCVNSPWWKFWVKSKWSEDELLTEGIKAAKAYIRKKGFRKMDFGTLALVKACLSNGFREGVKWRDGVKQ